MPQLSIVIPVYDNWWLTARCLRELDRARAELEFETIVVDNASSDETPEAIREFPWVRYVRHETNRNFAGACNAGAKLARAPLVLFLNNDAYPLGDALREIVAAFERPEVAIAGGALYFEDGTTQAAGLAVLQNAHWHYYCRNLNPNLADVERSRDALGVSGAAMAVRTEWFVESGGFDESFVNGFEDVDLCMRAREADLTIRYCAQAQFVHYEAASAGRFDREAENERRFYARWTASMAALPRTVRGAVGAIAVQAPRDDDPLRAAARSDLENALRGFGHPVVSGAPPPWRRLDRRFRQSAALGWFTERCDSPGVTIRRDGGGIAAIRTAGAVEMDVPWLPCAAYERVEHLKLRRSDDPACVAIGVIGAGVTSETLGVDAARGAVAITPAMLLGEGAAGLACVVHAGLSDDAAFGNVLLAQSGLPAVALATDALRVLFPPDVALLVEPRSPGALRDAVARFVSDPPLRARYGRMLAADARRRFAPRRSAIRVVDLLCAARFGLERYAVP